MSGDWMTHHLMFGPDLYTLSGMNSLIAQVEHWKARAENAEKRWELLKSKFPGVAETIEDLIEKEENEHEHRA